MIPDKTTQAAEENVTTQILTICICTMNRPEVLERCLDSIGLTTTPPSVTLVSDDSSDPALTEAVCKRYPWVTYVRGPRRGLCSNRNHVARLAKSEYISLLDDDATVSVQFVTDALETLRKLPNKTTIITGDVIEGDLRIQPRNPSFWGHFTKAPGSNLKTINLNCNIFPSQALKQVTFDESIAYGYEDMDLCSQLVAIGYKIHHDPNLYNYHFPPAYSPELRRMRTVQSERARFYTSLKRYYLWERSPLKVLTYLLLAPLHRAGHALLKREIDDIPHCVADMFFALKGTYRELQKMKSQSMSIN